MFLSSSAHKSGATLNWQTDANWFMEGEQSYNWFGYAMACTVLNNKERLLVVSAPGTASTEVSNQVALELAAATIIMLFLHGYRKEKALMASFTALLFRH